MTEIHEIVHAERKILDKIGLTNQMSRGESREYLERLTSGHAEAAQTYLQQRKLRNFLSLFTSAHLFLSILYS